MTWFLLYWVRSVQCPKPFHPFHQPPRPSEVEEAPDTHEMSFNELWQNKKGGISFSDVLDIVNPLQHIPVISTVYRMIKGGQISMTRMAGSALYVAPRSTSGARCKSDGTCAGKGQHAE